LSGKAGVRLINMTKGYAKTTGKLKYAEIVFIEGKTQYIWWIQ
jgi:hypothetical protein